MIVVSNTTPLRYLVEVDAINVLPQLFGSVITTPAVVAELRASHFPDKVRAWAATLPAWLSVNSPRNSLPVTDRIDPGEAEAIALAEELEADRLLIDEEEGVSLARSKNIPVLRTLTLLAVAAEEQLIPLETTLRRLADETKFRATKALFDRFLNQDEALRQLVMKEREKIIEGRPNPARDPKLGRGHER